MGRGKEREQIKQQKAECFVLYYDGQPMNLVRWKEYEGWTKNDKPVKRGKKVPKALYWTEGTAKNGIAQLPDWIDRSKVTIVRFTPTE